MGKEKIINNRKKKILKVVMKILFYPLCWLNLYELKISKYGGYGENANSRYVYLSRQGDSICRWIGEQGEEFD